MNNTNMNVENNFSNNQSIQDFKSDNPNKN